MVGLVQILFALGLDLLFEGPSLQPIAMAGITDLDQKPPMRVHVWKDPALAARAGDIAMSGPGGTAA